MSKELKNITGAVMDQIHHGKIKMRPKVYFVIGSLLTFFGVVASMLISVFFVALVRFSLRTHGPMGEYRLNQILSSFPWWAAAVALLGFVIGIWLIRKYDFSYKINFKVLVIGFIVAIIVAGLAIDATGLNDIWFRQGPKAGIMKQYLEDNNMKRGEGCIKLENN